MSSSQYICRLLFTVLVVFSLTFLPGATQVKDSECQASRQRLVRGDVVIEDQNIGQTKFVVARILIDAPPDQVWPILTNPFEFQERISPRMKQVDVLTDRADMSVLKVTVSVGFLLPAITYSVESRYSGHERIDFKRVDGNLKDFKGCWVIAPKSDGTKTEVEYSMYIDPGFPVPQWIVRAGVREELPKTLIAMRDRVMAVYIGRQMPVSRSILAAAPDGHVLVLHGPGRS